MNILSFDVEDWFIVGEKDRIDQSQWPLLESRIADNVASILEILAIYNFKATFFVQGWVAEQFPETIKEISREGHEIAYHSYAHQNPSKQDKKEFEEDLVRGLNILKEITGKDITMYRAPYFSITEKELWIYPILAKHGINISSSIKSFQTIKGTEILNRPVKMVTMYGTITEYPLSQLDLQFTQISYSGSGYFRIMPFSLLEKVFKKDKYNMVYFHPRDFDLNIPKHPDLSCFRNWKMRVNSTSTVIKLNHLFSKLIFHSLADAHTIMNNQKMEAVFV